MTNSTEPTDFEPGEIAYADARLIADKPACLWGQLCGSEKLLWATVENMRRRFQHELDEMATDLDAVRTELAELRAKVGQPLQSVSELRTEPKLYRNDNADPFHRPYITNHR